MCNNNKNPICYNVVTKLLQVDTERAPEAVTKLLHRCYLPCYLFLLHSALYLSY